VGALGPYALSDHGASIRLANLPTGIATVPEGQPHSTRTHRMPICRCRLLANPRGLCFVRRETPARAPARMGLVNLGLSSTPRPYRRGTARNSGHHSANRGEGLSSWSLFRGTILRTLIVEHPRALCLQQLKNNQNRGHRTQAYHVAHER
jgi:hypothetical protein